MDHGTQTHCLEIFFSVPNNGLAYFFLFLGGGDTTQAFSALRVPIGRVHPGVEAISDVCYGVGEGGGQNLKFPQCRQNEYTVGGIENTSFCVIDGAQLPQQVQSSNNKPSNKM